MKKFTFCILLAIATTSFGDAKLDKIKLRDGTELEGNVSGADAVGFSFRTKYGSVHYNWTDCDLNYIYKNTPALYQFMVQKTREQAAVDQIVSDAQILQFLAGKFVFKSDANKVLKNYANVLQQLDSAAHNKNIVNRSKAFTQINSQSRSIVIAFDSKCAHLQSVTRTAAIQTLLANYRRAMEAFLANDQANFISGFTFCKQTLAQYGY